MRRFTTPIHTFTFPQSSENYDVILLTYSQNGKEIVTKTKDDFTFNGVVGKVTLTQEETGSFITTDSDDCCTTQASLVEIQIRAIDVEGNALATEVWKRPVRKVLHSGVL